MKKFYLVAVLLLAASCSSERTTAPQLQQSSTKQSALCEFDARSGYYVRYGKSYSDVDCTVEIPN